MGKKAYFSVPVPSSFSSLQLPRVFQLLSYSYTLASTWLGIDVFRNRFSPRVIAFGKGIYNQLCTRIPFPALCNFSRGYRWSFSALYTLISSSCPVWYRSSVQNRYKISTKSSNLLTLRILHGAFSDYYSSNITNARQEVNFDNKHEIMCKAIYTWLQKTNRQEFSTLAGFSTIVNTIITKFYLPANSAFNFSVKAGTILFKSPTIP